MIFQFSIKCFAVKPISIPARKEWQIIDTGQHLPRYSKVLLFRCIYARVSLISSRDICRQAILASLGHFFRCKIRNYWLPACPWKAQLPSSHEGDEFSRHFRALSHSYFPRFRRSFRTQARDTGCDAITTRILPTRTDAAFACALRDLSMMNRFWCHKIFHAKYSPAKKFIYFLMFIYDAHYLHLNGIHDIRHARFKARVHSARYFSPSAYTRHTARIYLIYFFLLAAALDFYLLYFAVSRQGCFNTYGFA